MAKPKLVVKQNEKDPVPIEVLSSSIRDIARAMRQINSGPLKRHAVVLLIQDICKISQRDIRAVLEAMDLLESTYLKPGK